MAKFASFGMLAAAATLAQATSLANMCTDTKAKATVPSTGLFPGIVTSVDVTANPVYNETVADEAYYPDATFDYCNVLLNFWLPAPEKFNNRWVSTGGFGFAINYETSMPGGFHVNFDDVFPLANGTSNLNALYMFGYQAHHEMSSIGKAFTRNSFDLDDSTKLYAYYQGCSEGGREGFSQVQRFPDEWDGAVIGAPALRYGQQQVYHLFPQVAEKTLNYTPPYCELEKIVSLTISACDVLDGKADGVIGRSDLCKLHFDFNPTVGEEYHCSSSEVPPNRAAQ
ncbi:tannase and feruloyl esterase [Penicillium malachiteum]|uniref:tannase and feruloyl esterase n=1 Tax=Penicillium malachiteum TaxID=1324776 RepID=UPI002549292F|nr:tannase and feruloyl esterase [Penicillium malachiteum]KAJ5730758.1 tannase and feruloyl esterase [Penicillium malachiteum]